MKLTHLTALVLACALGRFAFAADAAPVQVVMETSKGMVEIAALNEMCTWPAIWSTSAGPAPKRAASSRYSVSDCRTRPLRLPRKTAHGPGQADSGSILGRFVETR